MSIFGSLFGTPGQINTGIADLGGAASAFGSAAAAGDTAAADELTAQALGVQSQADTAEAAAYTQNANLVGEDITTEQQATAEQTAVNQINEIQQNRTLELTQGTAEADAAANGLGPGSGSVSDILRANAQQGKIAEQLYGLQSEEIQTQGQITVTGLTEQQVAYESQAATATAAAQEADLQEQAEEENAQGAEASAAGSTSGGILKVIGGIASIFGL